MRNQMMMMGLRNRRSMMVWLWRKFVSNLQICLSAQSCNKDSHYTRNTATVTMIIWMRMMMMMRIVPRDLCFRGSQPPLGFEMFCMRRPAASDCMKSATCLSPGSPASPVAGQLKNHSSCQLLPYFSCSCSCFSCSLNRGGKVEPVAN